MNNAFDTTAQKIIEILNTYIPEKNKKIYMMK